MYGIAAKRQAGPGAEEAIHTSHLASNKPIVFPRFSRSRLVSYLVTGDVAELRHLLKTRKLEGTSLCSNRDETDEFLATVKRLWGNRLVTSTTAHLEQNFPEFSARKRLTRAQVLTGISLALGIALLAPVAPYGLWLGFSLLMGLLFGAVLSIRLMAVMRNDRERKKPVMLQDALLPTYSVLVPVYRERDILASLLSALQHLDYPADKLDIKLVLEEDDLETREALANFTVPEQFEIILVPPAKLRTKPRALNYAMAFARGELLTIYDAEDRPQPSQLRLAASVFATAAPDLACLQARLVPFNGNENWLTRQFALEYDILFASILPALAAARLPIPLGGTSNHFRTALLLEAGGWDPYNVTEDADLGYRFARRGFSTDILDSDTFEEACPHLKDWRRQRARWLKGFLQTWLVHMRNPLQSVYQMGVLPFISFHAMTLGAIASALSYPFFLLICFYSGFGSGPHHLLTPSTWAAGFSFALFSLCPILNVWLAVRAVRRNGWSGWWFAIITLPLYWLLLCWSALQAVKEFASDVHGWNKTPHGRSKLIGSQ